MAKILVCAVGFLVLSSCVSKQVSTHVSSQKTSPRGPASTSLNQSVYDALVSTGATPDSAGVVGIQNLNCTISYKRFFDNKLKISDCKASAMTSKTTDLAKALLALNRPSLKDATQTQAAQLLAALEASGVNVIGILNRIPGDNEKGTLSISAIRCKAGSDDIQCEATLPLPL